MWTRGSSRWAAPTASRAGGSAREVILPGALSSILVGLRFSLGLMWVILIVAETISAQAGIGYLTTNAREFLQTDVVLVGILLYALAGQAGRRVRARAGALLAALAPRLPERGGLNGLGNTMLHPQTSFESSQAYLAAEYGRDHRA